MRPALRLFAAVKQGRVLEPGTPTGLTGLLTHPAPRSTLIYLYSSTLSKLQQIPETSVYRQATEALTKKRLAIIEAVKPAGFDAWEARMNHAVDNLGDQIGPKGLTYEGRRFILAKMWKKEQDVGDVEWDGLKPSKGMDGPKTQAEMDQLHEAEDKLRAADALERPSLEPEPLFTIEQIGELEQKIGAGLLEEVIQVAEGELKLASIMVQNRVWEDLTEKSPEGQWAYFERGGAHANSQKPPA